MEMEMKSYVDSDMTLARLLDVEDALDCQRVMTREQFLACIMQREDVQKRNAMAWDYALDLVSRMGTWMRAYNAIQRRINSFRSNQYA